MSRRSGLAILLTSAMLAPLLFVPQSHAETGRVPESAWPKTASTAALVQQPSGEISPNVLKALGIPTRTNADPAAMQQEVARQITGDQNATVSALPPSTDAGLMRIDPIDGPRWQVGSSAVKGGVERADSSQLIPSASGLPEVLNIQSPLSTALITAIGGVKHPRLPGPPSRRLGWNGRHDGGSIGEFG